MTWSAGASAPGETATHIMFGTVSEPLPSKIGLAKGVDFKGIGGYIVGPGSVHISGKRYTWDRSAMPDGDSPQAPPPWLVKMVLATKLQAKAGAHADEDASFYKQIVSPASPGNRRARLSELAGHVLGTAYPNRGVLVRGAMIDHTLHVTPDLSDFTERGDDRAPPRSRCPG